MPSTTFSVDLVVMTKDKLRRIQFRLVKDVGEKGKVAWSLEFTLLERAKATDKFNPDEPVVKLTINISKALEEKAAATLAEGFDDAQTSAALAAGDSAKLLKQGEISEASFRNDMKRVIARRGA
jgi:hypothetical protein